MEFDNVIPIIDFLGDPQDEWLLHLKSYLKSFLSVTDVRNKIKENFH